MAFKKGQSGNPKGRPPKPVEDAKQSVLLRLFDEAAEAEVIRAQIDRAKEGDTPAATWLWDRKYGKITERKDVTLHAEHWVFDPTAADPPEAD